MVGDDLTINGRVDAGGELHAAGKTVVGGDLDVNGESVFSGKVNANGHLSVRNGTDWLVHVNDDQVAIQGNLRVHGAFPLRQLTVRVRRPPRRPVGSAGRPSAGGAAGGVEREDSTVS
ncbi:hypothetical protein [Streptomyces sp. NPDC002573]|uniref:hypothetical protein n=1 Tax=Streptomyces sp. NPDC002573 TaxID=3364651 RepID=UPI0036B53D59